MGDVRDIRSHPKFRRQRELDPEDPNYERDVCQEWLDSEGYPPAEGEEKKEEGNPLHLLRTRKEIKALESNVVILRNLAICQDCQFKKDVRPWWRRVFYPDDALQRDLRCLATSQIARNPLGALKVEVFAICSQVNPYGTCQLFKPKITY